MRTAGSVKRKLITGDAAIIKAGRRLEKAVAPEEGDGAERSFVMVGGVRRAKITFFARPRRIRVKPPMTPVIKKSGHPRRGRRSGATVCEGRRRPPGKNHIFCRLRRIRVKSPMTPVIKKTVTPEEGDGAERPFVMVGGVRRAKITFFARPRRIRVKPPMTPVIKKSGRPRRGATERSDRL